MVAESRLLRPHDEKIAKEGKPIGRKQHLKAVFNKLSGSFNWAVFVRTGHYFT